MRAIFLAIPRLDWRAAAGQVLITALSVILALWASDWDEQRNRREFELTTLTEMHSALVSDHERVQQVVQSLQDRQSSLTQLITIHSEKPAYDASMDKLFGAAFDFRRINGNDGAYESLKSLGIDRVTDPALRTAITRVYEVDYPRMDRIGDIEESVLWEVVRPYYLRHFRNLEFGSSATPLDYQLVIADPEHLNIIQYKLAGISTNWVPTYEAVRANIADLIGLLEEELEAAGSPVPAMLM